MPRSFSFNHAIVRRPSASIIDGLRAVDKGTPDLAVFKHHHDQYIEALQSTGAHVTILDALEAFPDSVFVEDTSLCLEQGAIILRPGAPSRLGEAGKIRPALENFYTKIMEISAPGLIDGGDILVTETEIMVGTSARTNDAGIEQLSAIACQWDYSVRKVETPDAVLHFKTDCSLLDETTILTTKRLNASGCFDEYNVIETAEGEEACANSIRFNDLVIMPKGFENTQQKLLGAGYHVKTIGNSEAAKLDGGMSCLSLRFSPPGSKAM